jgi:hypothetical protein
VFRRCRTWWELVVFIFLSGLMTKSGSESSLSEEDELKQGTSGSKEAQTQGEEKESCSDEEKKNKENIDAEREQSTKTGMPEELLTQSETQNMNFIILG